MGFGTGDKWALTGGETDSATSIVTAEGQFRTPIDITFSQYAFGCENNDMDEITTCTVMDDNVATTQTVDIPALTDGQFITTGVPALVLANSQIHQLISALISTAGDIDRPYSWVLMTW